MKTFKRFLPYAVYRPQIENASYYIKITSF